MSEELKPSDFNPMKRIAAQEAAEKQSGYAELVDELADPANYNPLPLDGSYVTALRMGVPVPGCGIVTCTSENCTPERHEVKTDGGPPLIERPGTCTRCGCTDDNACVDELQRPCSWVDVFHTRCSFCI